MGRPAAAVHGPGREGEGEHVGRGGGGGLKVLLEETLLVVLRKADRRAAPDAGQPQHGAASRHRQLLHPVNVEPAAPLACLADVLQPLGVKVLLGHLRPLLTGSLRLALPLCGRCRCLLGHELVNVLDRVLGDFTHAHHLDEGGRARDGHLLQPGAVDVGGVSNAGL